MTKPFCEKALLEKAEKWTRENHGFREDTSDFINCRDAYVTGAEDVVSELRQLHEKLVKKRKAMKGKMRYAFHTGEPPFVDGAICLLECIFGNEKSCKELLAELKDPFTAVKASTEKRSSSPRASLQEGLKEKVTRK